MTVQSQQAPCPVCGQTLHFRVAQGRKSGKNFIMLLCPVDGRHFRGFITDRAYVGAVLSRLEDRTPADGVGQAVEHSGALPTRSKTILERACGS